MMHLQPRQAQTEAEIEISFRVSVRGIDLPVLLPTATQSQYLTPIPTLPLKGGDAMAIETEIAPHHEDETTRVASSSIHHRTRLRVPVA